MGSRPCTLKKCKADERDIKEKRKKERKQKKMIKKLTKMIEPSEGGAAKSS